MCGLPHPTHAGWAERLVCLAWRAELLLPKARRSSARRPQKP